MKQQHELLGFIQASFEGTEQNWIIFEKEACTIYQTPKELDFLLVFDYTHVFPDHRDLLFSTLPLRLILTSGAILCRSY